MMSRESSRPGSSLHAPTSTMRATAVAAALVCCAWLAAGCTWNNSADSASRERPHVVCTIGMIADIARNVAGEHADVTHIIGAGVDPHLYQPTTSDVRTLSKADLILYNGLLLEGRMGETLDGIERRGGKSIAVTQQLEEQYLLAPDDAPDHHDPHVWMDVSAWSRCVDVVTEALCELAHAHASSFVDNAAAYKLQLRELDEYVRRVMTSIPDGQRVLITAHDAFNYFGRAYDIDVRGIQGLSTESEAGIDSINRLVDLLVDSKISAVFVETSVSKKNVRALIEGAKARGHTVTVGGELFSDAMGPAGTYEGTYIGMIDHNATIIARALGGNAPETGMNGKLTHQKQNSSRAGGK